MSQTNPGLHENVRKISAQLCAGAVRLIPRKLGRWAAERRLRRTTAELYSLPDHVLRDIGIRRVQIHALVHEGFEPSNGDFLKETVGTVPAVAAPHVAAEQIDKRVVFIKERHRPATTSKFAVNSASDVRAS